MSTGINIDPSILQVYFLKSYIYIGTDNLNYSGKLIPSIVTESGVSFIKSTMNKSQVLIRSC